MRVPCVDSKNFKGTKEKGDIRGTTKALLVLQFSYNGMFRQVCKSERRAQMEKRYFSESDQLWLSLRCYEPSVACSMACGELTTGEVQWKTVELASNMASCIEKGKANSPRHIQLTLRGRE